MLLKDYKTISRITGPLLFVQKTHDVGYNELVNITLPNGEKRLGQVLDTSKDAVTVQVFEGTTGIDRNASVRFLGDVIKAKVSEDMLDDPRSVVWDEAENRLHTQKAILLFLMRPDARELYP